jgi:hypothetical protein
VFLVVAFANKAREASCDLLLSVAAAGARAGEAWAFDLHSWRAGCSKNIQVCRYSTNAGSHAPFLGHATWNRIEFYRVVEAGETSWIPDMPTGAALTMSLWA